MTSRGEFEFLGRLLPRLTASLPANRELKVGLGDDCAEAEWSERGLLLATDMLLEGVHFDLKTTTAELVGRKALAVNLSDVAAMAGKPTHALISLAVPRQGGLRLADGVMAGIVALAKEFGVAVAGGDTNAWKDGGPLVVNVGIVGEAAPLGSVTRRGARAQDAIVVTGALGGSIFGRHLRFTPRIAAAAVIRERYNPSAMIDLSDGLGSDLRHILEQSGGLGAKLIKGQIPIHEDARLWGDGETRDALLRHAFQDGEDFELCVTMHQRDAERLIADQPLGVEPRMTIIGHVTEGRGTDSLRFDDGSLAPFSGFAHPIE